MGWSHRRGGDGGMFESMTPPLTHNEDQVNDSIARIDLRYAF